MESDQSPDPDTRATSDSSHRTHCIRGDHVTLVLAHQATDLGTTGNAGLGITGGDTTVPVIVADQTAHFDAAGFAHATTSGVALGHGPQILAHHSADIGNACDHSVAVTQTYRSLVQPH